MWIVQLSAEIIRMKLVLVEWQGVVQDQVEEVVRVETSASYVNPNYQGYHDLQIDLEISLLNYGIGLDWDGVLGKRPSYMQTLLGLSDFKMSKTGFKRQTCMCQGDMSPTVS